MSHAELARALGISPSTEGMYEQGRRTPGLDTLVKTSRLFGVSLDYLVTGAEYPGPAPAEKENTLPKNCPCRTCFWRAYMGF